jgi:hypothetical protein
LKFSSNIVIIIKLMKNVEMGEVFRTQWSDEGCGTVAQF